MHKSDAKAAICELRKILEDTSMKIEVCLESDELCSVVSDHNITIIKNIGSMLGNMSDRLYASEVNTTYEFRNKDYQE